MWYEMKKMWVLPPQMQRTYYKPKKDWIRRIEEGTTPHDRITGRSPVARRRRVVWIERKWVLNPQMQRTYSKPNKDWITTPHDQITGRSPVAGRRRELREDCLKCNNALVMNWTEPNVGNNLTFKKPILTYDTTLGTQQPPHARAHHQHEKLESIWEREKRLSQEINSLISYHCRKT